MLDGKLRNTSNFIGISCDSTFSFRFPSCLVCLPHYPNPNKKTYVTPPPPPSTTRAVAEAASKPHNMVTLLPLSLSIHVSTLSLCSPICFLVHNFFLLIAYHAGNHFSWIISQPPSLNFFILSIGWARSFSPNLFFSSSMSTIFPLVGDLSKWGFTHIDTALSGDGFPRIQGV